MNLTAVQVIEPVSQIDDSDGFDAVEDGFVVSDSDSFDAPMSGAPDGQFSADF